MNVCGPVGGLSGGMERKVGVVVSGGCFGVIKGRGRVTNVVMVVMS